jgi:DNA-binding LytR/AlgR family response regulator
MMTTINCLIVDDEPIARDIIKSYCNHLPYLHISGCCSNAFEAREFLVKESVDLIFLDINMPVLNGISFLRTLTIQPQVIFTTAYKEYASEAFDIAACDYLVKPFSLDRFMVAVDKATQRLSSVQNPVQRSSLVAADALFLKADGKIYQLSFADIFFAEASANSTKVICSEVTINPNITFSGFGSLLPSTLFIKVHRSYIINKSKITRVEGNKIFMNQYDIPIGSNYKESFLKALGL